MSVASPAQAPVSAATLLDSFGINTHASFDTVDAYDNSALVIRALNYLNIGTVREAVKADGVPAQVLSAMADAGIKFNIATPNSIAADGAAGVMDYVDLIAAFATAHKGAVITIEGQNEVNGFGTSLGGDTSIGAAVEIQKLLYTAVKANQVLADTKVLNFTIANDDAAVYSQIGNLAAYSDYANAHIYTGSSSNISQRFANSFSLASAASAGNKTVITEAGFTTLAGSGVSVDELAQAKMTMSQLLLGFDQGAVKTYVYSLFDTPGGAATEQNNYFGLFNANGSPKLAATAVHNMTTLLGADQGRAMEGTFDVAGLGTDGHAMNVVKSSGATDIVLWRDVPAWNVQTGTASTIAPSTVTVMFSTMQARVYVYSPLGGLAPIASYENVSSITLPVSDTPLVVELGTDHPLTLAAPVAPTATMSFDATGFVAQIDDLSKMTGLAKIELSGDHVLKVSSLDTMHDILKNYAGVLAKIEGGYSFAIANSGKSWQTDTRYDQAGTLVSTTTFGETDDGIRKAHLVHADGSTADTFWSNGVLQKAYSTGADGSRSTATYDHAGRAASRSDISADGVTTYVTYDAKGVATTKAVTNVDKSGEMYHYAITGQSYASDHYVYAAGGAVKTIERFYANGKMSYLSDVKADGSRVVDNFDVKGLKTQEVIVAADGARTTTNFTYDTGGKLTARADLAATATTYQTFDATGATLTKTVTNADKSGEMYHYAITGQSYASDHYVYAAGGAVKTIERFYANGKMAYLSDVKADGSRVVDNFDVKGLKTQEIVVAADGARTTTNFTYDTGGKLTARADLAATATTYQTFDATGATLTKTVTNADKGGEMYHYAIAGQSYASEHYVYGAGGAVKTIERFYANGKMSYLSEVKADGSRVVDNFDVKGLKTQEIVVATDGTRATTNFTYDTGGKLTARADIAASGVTTYQTFDAKGATLTKTVTNADKSGEMYNYAITGQPHTSEHYVYATGGEVKMIERFFANGKMAYLSDVKADGSRVVDNFDVKGLKTQEVVVAADGARTTTTFAYDAAGKLTARGDNPASGPTTYQTFDATGATLTRTVTNADKSGEMYNYAISGQAYASEHYVYAAGGVVKTIERFYTNGKMAYLSDVKADGSREIDSYNVAGLKTQEVVVAADGGRVTTNFTYDAAGRLATRADIETNVTTYQTFDANGAALTKTVTNADKSGEMYNYAVAGQPHTSEHYVYSAGGGVKAIERYYADGKMAYSSDVKADGSRIVDSYNVAGLKTQHVVIAADGSRDTSNYNYDGAGRLTARSDSDAAGVATYWSYDAASGATMAKTITNPDKSGEMWHYGIPGQSFVSDHYVYGKSSVVVALQRFHADGSLDYAAEYRPDGSKVIDTYDAVGHKLLSAFTAADGTKSFHAYDEIADNQAATANLFNYTSASGGRLTIAGTPTVNVVDADGHVLHALDASAYTIRNGVFTLNSGALTGALNAGDHAYVDVTYAVSNGTVTAPASTYSIQIDGTLHVVSGAGTLAGSAAADRFVVTASAGNSIVGFGATDGDKIDFSRIDAVSGNGAGTLDHFTFVAGGRFTGQAGQLIAVQDTAYSDGAHWLVQGDTAGDGTADFQMHVTALNGHMLTGSDFLLG